MSVSFPRPRGGQVVDAAVAPGMTLLRYLRTKLGLTGTKLGCGEGGCGACTVMVSGWSEQAQRVQHRSVNACLSPVLSMHGGHHASHRPRGGQPPAACVPPSQSAVSRAHTGSDLPAPPRGLNVLGRNAGIVP